MNFLEGLEAGGERRYKGLKVFSQRLKRQANEGAFTSARCVPLVYANALAGKKGGESNNL